MIIRGQETLKELNIFLGMHIKKLRKEKALTQDDLANILGVGKTTISSYETGNSEPNNENLVKIAETLNVSIDYLLKGSLVTGSIDSRKVPLLNSIKEDEPIKALQNTETFIEIPLLFNNDGNDDIIALHVTDDSMNNAKLNCGDIMIINLQDTVQDGEIVVVIDNNEVMIRRFYRNGNLITLACDSNKFYPPILKNINKDNVKVIGKVIGAIINIE